MRLFGAISRVNFYFVCAITHPLIARGVAGDSFEEDADVTARTRGVAGEAEGATRGLVGAEERMKR
jgi:hypothetical protein